jgi:hypothetical protein
MSDSNDTAISMRAAIHFPEYPLRLFLTLPKLLKMANPNASSVRLIQQYAPLKSFRRAAHKIRASPLRNALITRITAPDTTQTRTFFAILLFKTASLASKKNRRRETANDNN